MVQRRTRKRFGNELENIRIMTVSGARHHLEAQSFFSAPLSLVRVISLALYDWEHLECLQERPAEAKPYAPDWAIAERLLSRIEEFEHSVVSL